MLTAKVISSIDRPDGEDDLLAVSTAGLRAPELRAAGQTVSYARRVTADGRDRDGRTPLHYAALDGRVADVERLIAEGADVTAADRQGFTPLHFACQQNHESAVVALLAAGAPLAVRDGWGNTPLFRAVFSSRGDPAIVQRLVAAGADPDTENLHGVSPRGLARTIASFETGAYFDDERD